jgi:dTMP kinase
MLGLLITFEGIDGSGKSTAIRRVAAMLKERFPERKIVLTAEPTSGAVGRILRAELAAPCGERGETPYSERMQELFLFLADHADQLTRTIIPSLNEGAIILSDRYADSTAAYQGMTLKGIVPDPVSWIQDIFRPWNIPPDRTLLFLLEPEAALKRMQSRPGKEKFERLEFLRSVDENFRRMALMQPQRFTEIDASHDEETVALNATSAVLDIIGKRH